MHAEDKSLHGASKKKKSKLGQLYQIYSLTAVSTTLSQIFNSYLCVWTLIIYCICSSTCSNLLFFLLQFDLKIQTFWILPRILLAAYCIVKLKQFYQIICLSVYRTFYFYNMNCFSDICVNVISRKKKCIQCQKKKKWKTFSV